MAPIDKVLAAFVHDNLSRSGDSGQQWLCKCPAHEDDHPSLTIGVGGDGRVLFNCFANCPVEAILERRGLVWADLFEQPDVLTVAQLAAYKRIPAEWLKSVCGVYDRQENRGVAIPYYTQPGKQGHLFARYRTKLNGARHTIQPKGEKLQAYGQDRLADAKKAKELIVVEGESDCWSLWYTGFPALGLPGANATKTLLPTYLNGIDTIYLWQEPGDAGAAFVDKLARRIRNTNATVKVVKSETAKDPSALYIRDPEAFPVAMRALLLAAADVNGAATAGGKMLPGAAATAPPLTPNVAPGFFGCTDLGNARRLIARHGSDLRYVKEWKSWLAWDGKIWVTDARAGAMQFAKETAQSMYTESGACPDPKMRQTLAQHAMTSEGARSLNAMVDLAASEPGVEIGHKILNDRPWSFACPNGTIDLRTGVIRPPERSDFLTTTCATPFDPSAKCPLWEKFLAEVFADKQPLISYIQRLVGYCLTGDVSAHMLVVFWGDGGNGKGSLLNTLLRVLGNDYSATSMPDFLLTKHCESHPTEIADLHGKRLVVCQETHDGGRLNESLVKWLTGGDLLKARRMRENLWQFSPTHKLILSTNYRPVIRGTDRGIWRRLRLIPFEVTFEGTAEDRLLSVRLLQEAQGILAWAVRGCLDWQAGGERTPPEVVAATEEYMRDEDIIQRFITQKCVVGMRYMIRASVLYAEFKQWQERSNEHMNITQTRFGRRLASLGYESRTSNGTIYDGIALAEESNGTPEPFSKNGSAPAPTKRFDWLDD